MPRRKPLQTNFSAGELAPELRGRLDTEQYQNGAKSLLNRRCLIGGGTKRRPGSWYEAELVGASRVESFIVDAVTSYILVFSSGRMDAYSVNATTGRLTAAGSLTLGNDSFTKVLLPMDGADASTTFTDTNAGGSAHTWTANGNAQIDTAQFVFGGASGLFDGTGDYLSASDHADFALGSDDFTISWRSFIAAGDPGGVSRSLAGQIDSAATNLSRSFEIERLASNNHIQARLGVGSTIVTIETTSAFTGATNPGWHHFAVVRNGTLLMIFVDGILQAATTIAGSINNSTNQLAVGRAGEIVANSWNGWIDHFDLSVGIARWTASFTVPTSATPLTPWTGDIWSEMDYAQVANTAFLTHPTMPPQKLVRIGAASWSLAPLTFFTGRGGRLEQPYFKLADPSVSLTPSARTGSITVTANKPVFVPAHIGTRIRILRREILITAYTSATVVTGLVIEELRPTFQIEFTTAVSGFAVDQEVVGSVSGFHAIVTQIVGATTIRAVMIDTQHNWFVSERIVGPDDNEQITVGAPTLTTDAAVKEWDEQLFTSFNGYPSCVTLHRNRLLFGGHPAVANALIGSKNSNLYSFDVDNASDGDGIFETIGDAGASSIVQLHSAEQLLVFTDLGPYYVPEGATSPFRPTSIAFFPFGSPWSVTATLEPKTFDDGVLFASQSLIIKARPSGDQSRLWAADEVSLLSTHIVSNPTRVAVTSNFANGSERYAVLVNDDGTLAALQLVEAQKIRNMTPWTTAGDYTSVAAVGSFLYGTVERTINGSLRYFLEFFDDDLTLDLVTEYASQAAMDAGVPTRYGSTTVNVVTSDLAYHLGEYPPMLSTLPAGPYQVGLYYDTVTELLPPALDDSEGAHVGEMMRICQAYVQVLQSARFEANGHELSAYAVTDPVDIAPPRKNGWQQFDLLGWAVEPTIAIRQPDPLPLDLLAVKTIVAY